MSNEEEERLEVPETPEVPAQDEPSEAVDEVAQLQAEVSSWKDKYLRQAAEFDNYRKRVMREKAELIKNGGEKVISDLLPVLDDFERAQSSASQTPDAETLKEGLDLIMGKLISILSKAGLQKIDAVGQPFDVDYHEAIAMVPASSEELKGKVLDQVQAGYKLNDKVIRHAKVAVAQ